MKKFLKPSDLAKMSGLSVQSVRNYEYWGLLPEARRSETGYRLYEQRHADALRVARLVIQGFGWERARNLMQSIHQGNLNATLVIIDAYHAKLHQERQEVEQSLEMLRTTTTVLQEADSVDSHDSVDTLSLQKKRTFRIGEVAQQMGVRVSAVRFWEEHGLLEPVRDRESKYRLYDEEQVRRLRVIVLLRKVGYNFEAIRPVLQQLATGSPEQVLAAAEQRLHELQERSRRCVEATATLWSYIQNIPPL